MLKVWDTSDQEELICEMALGYVDFNPIISRFNTPHEAIKNFAEFLDESFRSVIMFTL